MVKLVLEDKYLSPSNDTQFRIGKAQVRRILSGKAKKILCEGEKYGSHSGPCQSSAMAITRRADGALQIGCTLIRKSQLARAKKWAEA